MWYDSYMANFLTDADFASAAAAVVFAQQVRKRHRRRTDVGTEARGQEIEAALLRLRQAMIPLRSALGRYSHMPQTALYEEERLRAREVSEEVQRERIKLHKMLSPAQRAAIQAAKERND